MFTFNVYGDRPIRPARQLSFLRTSLSVVSEPRTIARLWRDAVAAGRTTPAYLVAGRRRAGSELSWAEAADARRGVRERPARARRAQGRRLRDPRARPGSSGRSSTSRSARSARSRAPIYANSSAKDAGLHPRPLGVGRRPLRGRGPAREGRGGARRDPAPAARAHVRRSGRPGRARARVRGRAPDALREAADAIAEDDLFTYIYTSGTTGPPKGCMISHRNYYAMVAVVDDLPSASPAPDDTMLLYLPLAHNFGRLMHLSGAVRRLRDRLPARPAAGRRRAPGRQADRVPERAPRLREGPHRRRREVRRGDRRRSGSSSTGRSASAARVSALERAGKPVPRGLAAQHALADRLVYAKVKDAARRAPAARDLRRRAALARDRRVLPRDRHPPDRGLRPDRVHDRGVDEHARGATGSAPSAGRCPAPR